MAAVAEIGQGSESLLVGSGSLSVGFESPPVEAGSLLVEDEALSVAEIVAVARTGKLY